MLDAFLQPAASAHAGRIDLALNTIHVVMLVVFVAWLAFFVFTLARFRAKRDTAAAYLDAGTRKNRRFELTVVAVVALTLLALEGLMTITISEPVWADRVDYHQIEDQAVQVRVVAQQFAWNFWYPGADGIFGPQDPDQLDDTYNPVAVDRHDPTGQDDIISVNQLHLPVGRPALLRLTSRDVIHSLNIPTMRVKQDAVPGISTPVWFTPTKTTAQMREEQGNDEYVIEIACAQLCGNSHYRMRGFLTVETQEELEAWLKDEAEYIYWED